MAGKWGLPLLSRELLRSAFQRLATQLSLRDVALIAYGYSRMEEDSELVKVVGLAEELLLAAQGEPVDARVLAMIQQAQGRIKRSLACSR